MVDILQEVKNSRQETTRLIQNLITGRAAEAPGTSIFTKFGIQFPVKTMDDLNKFDEILNTETEFKDAVKELSEYGGDGNYHFVKRVLTALVSNEVAILFSWLGRKGKTDFHRLNIARLIICNYHPCFTVPNIDYSKIQCNVPSKFFFKVQQNRGKWQRMTGKLSSPSKDGSKELGTGSGVKNFKSVGSRSLELKKF